MAGVTSDLCCSCVSVAPRLYRVRHAGHRLGVEEALIAAHVPALAASTTSDQNTMSTSPTSECPKPRSDLSQLLAHLHSSTLLIEVMIQRS